MFTAIGLGVLMVVYFGLSVYGARRAMEIPRLPLSASSDSVGLDYEDVAFKSRDGSVVLRGWYLPGAGSSVILVVHGGFQNRVDEVVDTLGLTCDLVARGYSVLLFDLRGRGESEGKGLALSNIELDVGGAVDYLKNRRFCPGDICILGFCSGAASSCIFASQNRIGALILDGCFIDVPTEVTRQGVAVGVPEFLVKIFVPGLLLMTRLIYDYDMVNPVDIVGAVSCPILFIHEEKDEVITWEETNRLFRASDNPSDEIWEVSGARHSESYRTFPAEYIEKVDSFIRKALTGMTAGDVPGD